MTLSLAQEALWVNLAIFAVGAVIVWVAGVRLTRYADAVAERTGLGHVLIGALLLGGMTSLPELATTATAALGGNAPLAVNNVLGGVAMQVAVLALADAMIGRRGLSTLAGDSSLLLQGNGLMLALALAAAGITSGSIVVLGVDIWTTALLVVVVLVLAAIRRYEEHPYWHPDEIKRDPPATDEDQPEERAVQKVASSLTGSRLAVYTAVAGLIVVAAGYTVTRTGEAIADQTGLGASFVGAILLAAVTSLPELSTTMEAVRSGHHRLAFSNIFGTNLFDVGFLFVADALYRDAGVLEEVSEFSLFAALLGILLTGIYVAGILQRRKRVVFRMGIDSAVVLLVYIAGAFVLYSLR